LEAGDNQAQAGQDAVQLMTVHAAKGLEFDAVFITGLEEGLFPHENAMNDHEGLEEERRLMYVAITRARKRLYLSFSQTRMLHGQTRYNIRSRFLDELPEAALKWLTPKQGGALARTLSASWAGTSSPPKVESPAVVESRQGLRAKMRVFHNKFGEGVVVTVEGSGTDARAQVNFARHGVKWLALSVAKLTPI
jgi:DNA helicase-2/ATP-dependent DNA helicase PcrA